MESSPLSLRHIHEGAPLVEEQVREYTLQAIEQGEITFKTKDDCTPSLSENILKDVENRKQVQR